MKAYAAFVRNTEEIVLSTIRKTRDDVRRAMSDEWCRAGSSPEVVWLLDVREINIDWVGLDGENESKEES